MWRGGYDEDWERRKEYLIRTLFQDISILSPVPEEQDSQYESSVHVSPSSYRALAVSDARRRPCSPLPPLIVEREPNRHDEPEEYYQLLERRMKKLYRQLFVSNRSLNNSFEEYDTDESLKDLSSVETRDITFIIDQHRESNQRLHSNANLEFDIRVPLDQDFLHNIATEKHYSTVDQNRQTNSCDRSEDESKEETNTTNSGYPEDDKLEYLNTNSDNINDEGSGEQAEVFSIIAENKKDKTVTASSSSTVTSDPGVYYHQVTFQAEVHREASDRDNVRLSLIYEDHTSEEHIDEQRDDLARLERTRFSDLSIPINTRSTSEYFEDVERIEVMRSPRQPCVRTSYVTLQEQLRETSSESLIPEFARHSIEGYHPFDSLRDRSNLTKLGHCSDDFNKKLQSSTPKTSNKRGINDEKVSENTCLTFSSHKRRRYENAAIQDNTMIEWSSLRANFFIGTPKMFRLCGCKDHSCA